MFACTLFPQLGLGVLDVEEAQLVVAELVERHAEQHLLDGVAAVEAQCAAHRLGHGELELEVRVLGVLEHAQHVAAQRRRGEHARAGPVLARLQQVRVEHAHPVEVGALGARRQLLRHHKLRVPGRVELVREGHHGSRVAADEAAHSAVQNFSAQHTFAGKSIWGWNRQKNPVFLALNWCV